MTIAINLSKQPYVEQVIDGLGGTWLRDEPALAEDYMSAIVAKKLSGIKTKRSIISSLLSALKRALKDGTAFPNVYFAESKDSKYFVIRATISKRKKKTAKGKK